MNFPDGPVDKTLPSNGGGAGLIPGGGTKVPRAMGCSQNLKNKNKLPSLTSPSWFLSYDCTLIYGSLDHIFSFK